jgi:outer membrane receptor for ferrienterochelin and colicin
MMMRTKMSVACAAALTAAAACAQQSAPLDKPVATVEVKSNADSQRRNDTASRIVVTREDITKYGDQSVLDVLKRLPGVTIGDGAPRMRGLGAGYTQVLVNGERPPAGFSLETLSPESIEKIEVMRAATAEYSTQAVAGTINVILRKTVTKATREFKASAGGAAGNRNYNVNAALSDKAASADYTLSANLTRNDTENSLLTSAAVYGSGMAPTQLRREDSFSRNRWTEANVNARVNLALGSGNSVTWQTFANGFRSARATATRSPCSERVAIIRASAPN